MVAPQDGGAAGTSATGGSGGGGHAGGGGKGGGGGGGKGGSGGSGGGGRGGGGRGGVSGTSGKDAGCSLLTDALVEHSTTSCNATFSFESGIQGATIPAGTQAAFTGVTKSGAQTYCGTGALAIAASFSGTTGNTTKGEVDLHLGTDGGTAALGGKTLTVHVSANPACNADLKLTVVLVTTSGSQFPVRIQPVTANWTTASATLSADGGANAAVSLAIEATSFSNYQGTIYVDEVDIR